MPECRYLLAKMLWDGAQAEAKKPKANEDLIKDSLFGARQGAKRNGLGAYNHAINVYAKYSESSWAADAGEMTEQIAAFVKERYKKEIKTNIPPGQIEKLRKMKYQNAFELYRGQEYEKAVAAYKELLDRVKDETEDSVSARGVLADCYVNLRQNAKKGSPEKADYAKLAAETEDFVATQYKGKAEALVRLAGNETLRLAAKEHDMGERGRRRSRPRTGTRRSASTRCLPRSTRSRPTPWTPSSSSPSATRRRAMPPSRRSGCANSRTPRRRSARAPRRS